MFSVRSMVRSALAVGGAAVLLASGASAAVAAPAVFSSTGNVLLTPSTTNPISLSWGPAPGQSRTCVASGGFGYGSVSNTAGQGSLNTWGFPTGVLLCKDGYGFSYQTNITASGPALASVTAGSYSLTSPRLQVADVGTSIVINPSTTPVSFSAPYTNGTTGPNGVNPSTWTFSNTLVGYVTSNQFGPFGPHPLRLTGTLKVIGPSGPLTLS